MGIAVALTTQHGLRAPAIARSPATQNLNYFYNLLPRLSVATRAKWQYTPSPPLARHVLDLPVYQDRDFRVLRTPTLEPTTHYDLRTTRDLYFTGRPTNGWRIQIQNHSNPQASVIEPFRIPAFIKQ